MKTEIAMSICTYKDGKFEVMISDQETGKEITLEGKQDISEEVFDLINKIAPACVWTRYIQK